jgi:hypothetical protein
MEPFPLAGPDGELLKYSLCLLLIDGIMPIFYWAFIGPSFLFVCTGVLESLSDNSPNNISRKVLKDPDVKSHLGNYEHIRSLT